MKEATFQFLAETKNLRKVNPAITTDRANMYGVSADGITKRLHTYPLPSDPEEYLKAGIPTVEEDMDSPAIKYRPIRFYVRKDVEG